MINTGKQARKSQLKYVSAGISYRNILKGKTTSHLRQITSHYYFIKKKEIKKEYVKFQKKS